MPGASAQSPHDNSGRTLRVVAVGSGSGRQRCANHLFPTRNYYFTAHYFRSNALFSTTRPVKFRDAVISLVKKHAILRTAFVSFQEMFVLLYLSNFGLLVQEIRLKDDPSVITDSVCREADSIPVSFGVRPPSSFL
jgi:hypothetical protein